jgi:hypothetical protein
MHMKIKTTYEHFEKYRVQAERLGVDALKSIVLIITNEWEIKKALEIPNDKGWALNAIPLHLWDRCHGHVVTLLRQKGGGVWSLSDTVCTLKHVAIYYIGGAEFEGACALCNQSFDKYEAPHGRGDAICQTCMGKR